jgi:hypothetical protein
MQSKWMDAAIHTGNYHMQCDHYESIKPPSFYNYQHLNREYLTRDRERVRSSSEDHGAISANMNQERIASRSINRVSFSDTREDSENSEIKPLDKRAKFESSKRELSSSKSSRIEVASVSRRALSGLSSSDGRIARDEEPAFLVGSPKLDGGLGGLFPDGMATFYEKGAIKPNERGFASHAGGNTPSLFLQELAHLTSLLSAVALSTLRNDVDDKESPLDVYEIGSPWPEVDAGKVEALYDDDKDRWYDGLRTFLGIGRNAEQRSKYNSRRPLSVLGGVSDSEIKFLQMARGKYAKTQLCFGWLSEFITREHLNGMLGEVGPPIISRTIQFMGDGMFHYNQARKIMFIPFPFPHAQLSAAFVIVMIPLIPLLMDQYIENIYLGMVMTFLAQMVLSGINEVATELENPFRNVPNELPVVYWQAEFNEALLTMYSGYHPDFFWNSDHSINSSGNSKMHNKSTDVLPIKESKPSIPGNGAIDDLDLKKIVEMQGTILEKLLQEQVRLNNRLREIKLNDEKKKS